MSYKHKTCINSYTTEAVLQFCNEDEASSHNSNAKFSTPEESLFPNFAILVSSSPFAKSKVTHKKSFDSAHNSKPDFVKVLTPSIAKQTSKVECESYMPRIELLFSKRSASNQEETREGTL